MNTDFSALFPNEVITMALARDIALPGGAGTLASSTLETSTVDLSSEFTNLIIAQQAYDASSKVITTADQMTQALLQVIQ